MKHAVIFDLDGTLLDTLEDLRSAVNAALSLRGLPPRLLSIEQDQAENRRARARRSRDFIGAVLAGLGMLAAALAAVGVFRRRQKAR